ncbi:TonB-dependent siderophore receptor [Vibrio sp. T187]|uniref:TonB-dependent siderophore receptor n=1 Tax=Vibrio TaxID=662 RepID=UPI0010C9D405|nr:MULTISPECIES: TonB-dependent siderophore receptor [Vibrio]MBW3696075.1 TonB-dependent siderophore receptor [Vibrio sp. T187]
METVNINPKRKTLLCFAIGMALSSTAVAQEEQTNFEEVVVWGTKVSSSSESVYADDMSLKQADHMSDLLRDIPGVDVGGTHSVNQRINIRGMGETDLDIRLDGASQHANMFHHIGNLTLNPDIIKSADIQVGNNSVTQSGLGGAVYFETKDAKDLLRYDETFGVRVFGGVASNDSEQGSITLYGKLSDKVDALIYGHGVSRDNFEDGDGVETHGAAGDVYNVLAKVGFEPSELHRFQLSADMYRDSGDYNPRPDMSGSANNSLTGEDLVPTDYDRDTLTATYELRGKQHTGKVNVYSSTTEIVRDESVINGWRPTRLSENTAENQNVGVTTKFQSQFSLSGFDNTAVYGADYIDRTTSSYYGSDKFMEESTTSIAVFVEDTLYLTDDLFLTAGLRYDDFQRDATTSDKSFNEVTWALAADWQFAQDWAVFASTRSLFKGPELLETYIRYQDVAYMDEDIKAETGQNSQAGIRFDKQIDNHYLGATFTAFKTSIDDYIAEAYQGATASYRIYNLGDVEIQGFELSATYGYEMFQSKVSYSRSDNEDKTNGGPIIADNGNSSDIGDSIALTFDYQADSIDTLFGWTSIVVLEEDNVADLSEPKEAYDVHNLYAQWLPSDVENLSVTFGIDNVFDELYVSHASRNGMARTAVADDYEPGRNYKLSLAYQF